MRQGRNQSGEKAEVSDSPEEKSKRGRRNRRKGHQWQRDCVKLLRPIFPGKPVMRGYQDRGGKEAADVICPVLWPECKHGIRVNYRKALRQAMADMAYGRIPVVFAKDDNCKPVAHLLLKDFLEIIQEWWDMRNNWKPPPT
jgi:hypothetical protein